MRRTKTLRLHSDGAKASSVLRPRNTWPAPSVIEISGESRDRGRGKGHYLDRISMLLSWFLHIWTPKAQNIPNRFGIPPPRYKLRRSALRLVVFSRLCGTRVCRDGHACWFPPRRQ